MKKIIDLHVHSNCSDGLLSPKEIIDKAVANGVSVISIADHDTVDAYNDELFQYANSKGVQIIPAVEISTKTEKCGIHVLGYNFDLSNKVLLDKLASLRNARHDYLYQVSIKLKGLGYIVRVSDLSKIESVTKAHISTDIVSNPVNSDKLLETFGYIPEKGEFIEKVMNEGCPAYVEKNTITPVEASKLIRMAGGKVVLAHPVAYKHEDGLTDEEISDLISDMEVDGIEANYIYIDRFHNKINEIQYWNHFAKAHQLHTSLGSDFHKEDGVHPTIGLVGEDIKVSDSDILAILKWLSE